MQTYSKTNAILLARETLRNVHNIHRINITEANKYPEQLNEVEFNQLVDALVNETLYWEGAY